MSEERDLRLNHHRVTLCVAEHGYLRLRTEWQRAKGSLILSMPHWPSQELETLAARMLNQEFAVARYGPEGALHLRFADGLEMDVKPDPDYEAWEVRLSPGDYTICTPGGAVTVFRDLR